MVDITLLGTAATMPLPHRALSSVLLRSDGRTILFDCGEGTQTAARRAGVSLMKTDLIALTHYHGDHIFGLPGLLQTMNCLGRTEPLYVTGPDGLGTALMPALTLAGELQYDVRLITEPFIRLDALNSAWSPAAVLEAFPTEHRTASQGYRFTLARQPKFNPEEAKRLGIPVKYWKKLQRGETVEADGRRIEPTAVSGGKRRGLSTVFSGDTAPCAGLEAMSRKADLLICDATYGEDGQADKAALYGHCTFSQAAGLAAEAGVKRLWLAHFSQTIDPEECLPAARRFFPSAECGFDGKSISLGFEDE